LEFELWLSVFSDNHCSGYATRLMYSFLKVEFALEQAMKAQRENRVIALLSFNLCTIHSPVAVSNDTPIRSVTQSELYDYHSTPFNSSSSSSFPGFYNPLAGFSLLIFEVSRSHSVIRHSR
jgi:hypothetical protein